MLRGVCYTMSVSRIRMWIIFFCSIRATPGLSVSFSYRFWLCALIYWWFSSLSRTPSHINTKQMTLVCLKQNDCRPLRYSLQSGRRPGSNKCLLGITSWYGTYLLLRQRIWNRVWIGLLLGCEEMQSQPTGDSYTELEDTVPENLIVNYGREVREH